MKTIFLTGGNGFVGKNILEKLQEKYTILAPRSYELNLTDQKAVDDFFQNNQVDIVIHSANIGGDRKSGNTDILSENLKMFENIIRNSKHYKKLIQFGSGAEYNKEYPIIKVKENELNTLPPKDEYGLSKLYISNQIQNLDYAVSLKIFGLYGPYEDYDFKFISNSIVKALLGEDITIVQNVEFDYVFIDDFIRIVEYFIEHDAKYKLYNIGTNQKIDLYTLAKYIVNTVNKNIKITLLNPNLNKEYTCDSNRLISELKCTFTSHEEAIKRLVYYYKSILHTIDKDKIIADELAKKIKINK